MTKVLFVYGGRRVELANEFIRHHCVVTGYEASERVPLASIAEVGVGLPWDHPEFADDVAGTAEEIGADLIVPLGCGAAAVLAGADVPCPVVAHPPGTAKVCHDKLAFAEAMKALPDLYPFPRQGKPCVKKPRLGFGGNGVVYETEYDPVFADKASVYQARLRGPEYSVDAYFNRDGSLAAATVRERLRVAGGEVIESVTVEKPELAQALARVGNILPFHGPVCAQFMCGPDGPQVLEVNARFGGGCTLSVAAGMDLVGATLADFVRGESVDLKPGVPGVYLTRSYRDHVFQPEMASA